MRYRLTGSLEGGALAELFAAVADDRLPVVVKLFFPHTSHAAYAREVVRVAQRINAIPSPGLIRVREVGTVRGRLAVVREHLRGVTLSQVLQRLIRRELFLSPAVCFSLVVDYLDLVSSAHNAGVIHGAITPGNLLLSHGGEAAVCDFGAVQAIMSVAPLARLFASGGRSAYRAPEVVHGEPPSAASDVYSVAAVTYELLTLREPRPEGADPRRAQVTPPSRLDRRLSARLDSLFTRALDPSPARRYASCAELSEALRELIAVSGGVASFDERRQLARGAAPEASLGPVPFVEDFALGDSVALEVAEPRTQSGTPPPRRGSGSGLQLGGAAALRHPDGHPFDDDETDETDAEKTAATEPAWEAPPGALSGLRRRLLGQASASRPLRVRWVQDVNTPLPDVIGGSSTGAPVPFGRSSAVVPVRFPRRVTDTLVESPRAKRRAHRWWTERRVVLPSVGALVLVLVGLWIGRLSVQGGSKGVERGAAPELGVVVDDGTDSQQEVDLGYDRPPPTRNASFLSVTTNLTARVYIDGALVRRPTPLKRYPVSPGFHVVVFEALATLERRELTINLPRGQERALHQNFEHTAPVR